MSERTDKIKKIANRIDNLTYQIENLKLINPDADDQAFNVYYKLHAGSSYRNTFFPSPETMKIMITKTLIENEEELEYLETQLKILVLNK